METKVVHIFLSSQGYCVIQFGTEMPTSNFSLDRLLEMEAILVTILEKVVDKNVLDARGGVLCAKL